jgi:hypothetical protein
MEEIYLVDEDIRLGPGEMGTPVRANVMKITGKIRLKLVSGTRARTKSSLHRDPLTDAEATLPSVEG